LQPEHLGDLAETCVRSPSGSSRGAANPRLDNTPYSANQSPGKPAPLRFVPA
jgi:hypothetical protein